MVQFVFVFSGNVLKMKALTCDRTRLLAYLTKDEHPFSNGKAIIEFKRIDIYSIDLHAFEGTQAYFNYPRIWRQEQPSIRDDDASEFTYTHSATFIPYFNGDTYLDCPIGKLNFLGVR